MIIIIFDIARSIDLGGLDLKSNNFGLNSMVEILKNINFEKID